MAQRLVLTGGLEFRRTDTLILDKFRSGGDEIGPADPEAPPPLHDREHPVLIRQRGRGRCRVLDGWRRVRGALKRGFALTEVLNLGDIRDTEALAHVVRSGLLWPRHRDPWVLCTRLEKLESRLADLREPKAMARFLGIPAVLLEEAKRIRNVEVNADWDDPLFSLCTAFDSGHISRRELMTLSQVTGRNEQKIVLRRYVRGPKRMARLRALVSTHLARRPDEVQA